MSITNFDPLTCDIGVLTAAEAFSGSMAGGGSPEAARATRVAWGCVMATRATTVEGMVWKIDRAWQFYCDEPSAGAASALREIANRATAGEHVEDALTDLAGRLEPGHYVDLILSAAADAKALAGFVV